MNKLYTKRQIKEAIAHWTNVLESINESEDIVDHDIGVLRCSARDLIFKDAESLGGDVAVLEISLDRYSRRNLIPVSLKLDQLSYLKSVQSKMPECRMMIYIYAGKAYADSRWRNADDFIESAVDFEEYVGKSSAYNLEYPEEYDEEFALQFHTYESWIKYKAQTAVKSLKDILSRSNSLPYEAAADEVKIDENGTAYAIIFWRV